MKFAGLGCGAVCSSVGMCVRACVRACAYVYFCALHMLCERCAIERKLASVGAPDGWVPAPELGGSWSLASWVPKSVAAVCSACLKVGPPICSLTREDALFSIHLKGAIIIRPLGAHAMHASNCLLQTSP